MTDTILFAAATAFFVWVSRHALTRPFSHGFYRFFAWECILVIVLCNFPVWTRDPLAPTQLLSWGLLALSIGLAIHAVQRLRSAGRPSEARQDAELFGFERTSALVTDGVYRYIRHPMYAALVYLAWGAALKDLTALTAGLAGAATVLLLLTALRDEAECRAYFGQAYTAYMQRSRRFVPFLF